jgi:WD40 repeat protein
MAATNTMMMFAMLMTGRVSARVETGDLPLVTVDAGLMQLQALYNRSVTLTQMGPPTSLPSSKFGYQVLYSPDGAWLIASSWDGPSVGGRVVIYAAGTLQETAVLGPEIANDRFGFYMAVSPDSTKLAVCAPHSSKVYVYTLPYDAGQAPVELTVPAPYVSHTNDFGAGLIFSPDSSRVAYRSKDLSSGRSSHVYIHDVYTGNLIGRLQGCASCEHFGSGISWKPDGSVVAALSVIVGGSGEATLTIYDGASFAEITVIDQPSWEGFGQRMDWSHDGALLAVYCRLFNAGHPSIRVLDGSTYQEVFTIDYPTNAQMFGVSPKWSPDGSRLAVGSFDGVTIYDTSGVELLSIPAPDGVPTDYRMGSALSWTSDGSGLVIGASYDDTYGTDKGALYIAQNVAPATAPSTPASATGDPHLQNIHGERFDLMKPGKHLLINIPRGMSADSAMLRVQADAVRLGKNCGDIYFQELNVTGSWAEAKQAGGYHYSVSQSDVKSSEWVSFGKVALKVVSAHADSNVQYLNVYAKHLGQSGFAVGGLLGEDDHEDASSVPEACLKRVSLKHGLDSIASHPSVASAAVASLA